MRGTENLVIQSWYFDIYEWRYRKFYKSPKKSLSLSYLGLTKVFGSPTLIMHETQFLMKRMSYFPWSRRSSSLTEVATLFFYIILQTLGNTTVFRLFTSLLSPNSLFVFSVWTSLITGCDLVKLSLL